MHISFRLFVFSNYINCRIGDSLALYLCFFDDQQIRLWSGHVCSSFLSDGCQIWECLFPPSINVPTLFGLSFQWSLEFVDANRVLQSELWKSIYKLEHVLGPLCEPLSLSSFALALLGLLPY